MVKTPQNNEKVWLNVKVERAVKDNWMKIAKGSGFSTLTAFVVNACEEKLAKIQGFDPHVPTIDEVSKINHQLVEQEKLLKKVYNLALDVQQSKKTEESIERTAVTEEAVLNFFKSSKKALSILDIAPHFGNVKMDLIMNHCVELVKKNLLKPIGNLTYKLKV